MPGFAAFHVGITTVEAPEELAEPQPVLDDKVSSDDYVDGMSE
jgi:hypothetical protein